MKELSFYESRDGTYYHLCDLSGHAHHIPVKFRNCYQYGCWSWEERYLR